MVDLAIAPIVTVSDIRLQRHRVMMVLDILLRESSLLDKLARGREVLIFRI